MALIVIIALLLVSCKSYMVTISFHEDTSCNDVAYRNETFDTDTCGGGTTSLFDYIDLSDGCNEGSSLIYGPCYRTENEQYYDCPSSCENYESTLGDINDDCIHASSRSDAGMSLFAESEPYEFDGYIQVTSCVGDSDGDDDDEDETSSASSLKGFLLMVLSLW